MTINSSIKKGSVYLFKINEILYEKTTFRETKFF